MIAALIAWAALATVIAWVFWRSNGPLTDELVRVGAVENANAEAIEFALGLDDPNDARAFLDGFLHGDIDEWPEFWERIPPEDLPIVQFVRPTVPPGVVGVP